MTKMKLLLFPVVHLLNAYIITYISIPTNKDLLTVDCHNFKFREIIF